jgi:hypothetical protein
MSVVLPSPFRSPILLDVMSQDFSHLSIDDRDASIANVDLPRISPERDTYTDDEHKALDATILTMWSANRQIKNEPHLPSLLSNITNNDKRLTSVTPEEATKILDDDSRIKMVLRNAWRKEAFKAVRQLGAYAMRFLLFLSS